MLCFAAIALQVFFNGYLHGIKRSNAGYAGFFTLPWPMYSCSLALMQGHDQFAGMARV